MHNTNLYRYIPSAAIMDYSSMLSNSTLSIRGITDNIDDVGIDPPITIISLVGRTVTKQSYRAVGMLLMIFQESVVGLYL